MTENQVRQAGDNQVVWLPGQFTVQGYDHDVAIVTLGNGQVFAADTIYSLIFSPFCRDFYYSSNGEWVVRLAFTNPQPQFHGGTVAVWRGSTLLDRDRIRLY